MLSRAYTAHRDGTPGSAVPPAVIGLAPATTDSARRRMRGGSVGT
jgi:hypothetical protein